MSELLAYCRLPGEAAQVSILDRSWPQGAFRVSCTRECRDIVLALAAADWRRLALAKSLIAGELRRMPGCAALPLSWSGDGDPERLGHVQRWQVAATKRITPHLNRVTFRVEEAAFYAGDHHHVRLLLPRRRSQALVVPRPCPAGLPLWPEGELMPILRNYTVRAIRADDNELDVDFVLHDPAGPATLWARECRPDDEIGALGPIGQPIRHVARRILAGDETALPTILRQIEERHPGESIDAYVEVTDEADRQEVCLPDGCRLHWLRRDELVAALRQHTPVEAEDVFAYAGLEFATAQSVKTVFEAELGLPRTHYRALAYWRREGGGRMAGERS